MHYDLAKLMMRCRIIIIFVGCFAFIEQNRYVIKIRNGSGGSAKFANDIYVHQLAVAYAVYIILTRVKFFRKKLPTVNSLQKFKVEAFYNSFVASGCLAIIGINANFWIYCFRYSAVHLYKARYDIIIVMRAIVRTKRRVFYNPLLCIGGLFASARKNERITKSVGYVSKGIISLPKIVNRAVIGAFFKASEGYEAVFRI